MGRELAMSGMHAMHAFDKQAQWPPRFVWHTAGLQVGYCEAFIPKLTDRKMEI